MTAEESDLSEEVSVSNIQKRKHDDVINEATWKCDECSHRNFVSASECSKCRTSKEVQLKRKKEDPNDNNWICNSCRNKNWPHRIVCNRCKAPKAGFECQSGTNETIDWTCLNCDNINRPFRQQCNKCKMDKMAAISQLTGQMRTNQDWLCMGCGNSNYPYRIACNKCKLPKHEAMTATRKVQSDKPGNWLCFNCDNVNLPFRTQCNKCQIEKADGTNPETAFKRTNRDWKCTVCENINFYYRVFCNKCQLPKSEVGEEMTANTSGTSGPVPSMQHAFPAVNQPEDPYQQDIPAVPLPQELHGVPTGPIEKAAAQLYKVQVATGGGDGVSKSNYTVLHDQVVTLSNFFPIF